MKPRWTMAALGVAGLCIAAGSTLAQGRLEPPGTPGPTMKTLLQVEPRTPITNLPWTITAPGSYYLTTNLSSTGDGIAVECSYVTLDLMGFAISGDRSGPDIGIRLVGATNAPLRAITIRNGTIARFGTRGIEAEFACDCRFETLAVSSNLWDGIMLWGYQGSCNGNTISDCTIWGNGADGVALYGGSGECNGNTIVRSALHGNGEDGLELLAGSPGHCEGNMIVDCSLQGNTLYGVELYGTGGQCDGNTFLRCAFQANGSEGIYLNGDGGRCNGNTFSRCAILANGQEGIEFSCATAGHCDANRISECVVRTNRFGVYLDGRGGYCNGNQLVGCTVSANGDGIILEGGSSGDCSGNTVEECTASANGSAGIVLRGAGGRCEGNAVLRCRVYGNIDQGVYLVTARGTRVEDNHVAQQTGDGVTYGIWSDSGENNVLVRNTCIGQGVNILCTLNDISGPAVTNRGELAVTGKAAHAWANFTR